ncbi:MAG: hypothetical protein N2653_07830 [Burkholderiales bacterium]|nr:hypothetical protein [Burkholderiales bacterium]
MPWNETDYPAAMRNLPPAVRAKAIEIANALLAAGHPEGQAIRIAIARAKQWAGLAPRRRDRLA